MIQVIIFAFSFFCVLQFAFSMADILIAKREVKAKRKYFNKYGKRKPN